MPSAGGEAAGAVDVPNWVFAPQRRSPRPTQNVARSPTRYDVSRDELAVLLGDHPRYRVDQIWKGLYDQLAPPSEMTNLPRQLRADLEVKLPTALVPISESVADGGETIKFLSQIDGGYQVETVLMLYPGRATVCVSSQAGCAMACGFCATGQAGFDRHLTAGEIIEQVVDAAARARRFDRRLSNVVFMGMGEPLANEGPVWTAIERIHGDLGLSARHITVSTVGVVPGIRKLAARPLPVTLAVSLHAANDALRETLVPLNRRYPIDSLIEAGQEFVDAHGRRLSFEWAMMDGVNDRPSDAAELAALCRRLQPSAHVNLIPLNPTPGWPTTATPARRVREFRERLETLGATVTIRRNRGTDIDAACGQLAARRRAEHVILTARPSD